MYEECFCKYCRTIVVFNNWNQFRLRLVNLSRRKTLHYSMSMYASMYSSSSSFASRISADCVAPMLEQNNLNTFDCLFGLFMSSVRFFHAFSLLLLFYFYEFSILFNLVTRTKARRERKCRTYNLTEGRKERLQLFYYKCSQTSKLTKLNANIPTWRYGLTSTSRIRIDLVVMMMLMLSSTCRWGVYILPLILFEKKYS